MRNEVWFTGFKAAQGSPYLVGQLVAGPLYVNVRVSKEVSFDEVGKAIQKGLKKLNAKIARGH
jgi:hypothetical protein